jgi:ACT domain-containing protein
MTELGENATPESVKLYVEEKSKAMDYKTPVKSDTSSGRVILTSFGLNRPGVISTITNALSECNCDLHDISQKIMQEFYTIIMVVDISESPKTLKEIQDDLAVIAEKLNIKIFVQHEDVFQYMHRI